VHAPGGVEKHAAVVGDGGPPLKQIIEDRLAGVAGVHTLDRLLQLHLIAEQHDVARAGTHGHQVGQRDLAGFVHKQVIESLIDSGVGEQPGGARDKVRSGEKGRSVVGHVPDLVAVVVGVVPTPARLLDSLNRTPFSVARCSTAASRLLMALWLLDETPTRYPCSSSATMTWEPV